MPSSVNEKNEIKTTSTQTHAALPRHLVSLPDDRWALWRWTCLRGAGFPAQMVTQLAAPASAAAADQLISLEKEISTKQAEALEAVRRDLDSCQAPETKKQLLQALTQLKKCKLPAPLQSSSEAARRSFGELYASRIPTQTEFKETFRAGILAVSEKIRDVAANPRFRQAVLLQNRAALRLGIDSLLETGEAKRGKKQRQQEELVANYLQRYCVKNDSIGFFGPIGWAKFNPGENSIVAYPGPNLVSKSSVYFEQWCIESLAQTLEEDPALKEWMAPRRLPTFYLDGNKLLLPGGISTALSPKHVAILSRCTGEQTARDIATELLKNPSSGVSSAQDVYDILGEFVRRGVVAWSFEVPWNPYPERRLRRLLEGIGAPEKRYAALAMLDELEQARDEVQDAVGDPTCLDAALEKLELTFKRLTGKNTSRNAGQMYAGRTLIYQDCRRDMDLEIGKEIMHALSPPLMLILTTARWFTYRVAALFCEEFRKSYDELRRRSRHSYVELLQFWSQIQPVLLDREKRLFNRVGEEFRFRWDKVLHLPYESREVSYRSQELRSLVDEMFAAPATGWHMGRYNSPDVMIAASSLEELQKGDYFLVLGELHMAINTLRGYFAINQHPDVEQLFEAIEADMPAGQIVPMAPRSWPNITARTNVGLISRHNYFLEATHDSLSFGPRSKTLPISAFIVRESPQGLVVETRDGRTRFAITEFFGEMLSGQAVNQMKIVPSRPHIPRVVIDKLVIQREQWSFSASEMRFAQNPDEAERFLEARRWMHRHQLPRFVFARVHVEVKPFYIDFESPVYVEIMAKMVRRVLASDQPDSPVVMSEMLPTIEQLWLPDIAGQKYTSELRIVVVDQAQPSTQTIPGMAANSA